MTRTAIRALVAAAFVLAPIASGAAQRAVTVSGRVTTKGAPVVGARVRVVELGIERATTNEGRYSLIVPSDSVRGQTVTIIASFAERRIRYVPKSAKIQLSGAPVVQDFDLVLATGSQLDTTPTLPRTGPVVARASSAAEGRTVTDFTGVTDVASALAGRIPGLQVSAASTPSGSSSLVYRGRRSILGTSQPLYVLDGIVLNSTVYTSAAQRFGLGGFDYGNPLADLDIADVASIQFISSSDGSAKYGGRGANGVVDIRTKNGSDGPLFGTFTSFQSVSNTVTRLPSYQNRYGQGLSGKYEFFNGKGGGINDGVDQSWGPALDGRALPQASYREAGRPDVRLWSPNPDNVSDYFSRGTTNDALAGFQAHSGFGSLRVMGGIRNVKGTTPRDEVNRRSASAHGVLRPISNLEIAVNGFATEWKSDNAPGSGFNQGNPVSQFTRMGRQVDIDSLRSHLRDGAGQQISWIYANQNNPYFSTLVDSNLARRYHTVGGASLTYALRPWLTATARGGTDYYRDHRLFYVASGWVGGFPSYSGAGDFSKGGSEGNEIFVQQNTSSLRFDATKTLSQNSRLSFAVGADANGTRERIRTLGVDSARHVPSAGAPDTARLPDPITWNAHSRQTTVFGEAGASLPRGLAIRGTLRNAWSSILPGQHSRSLYPSVDASVDLSRAMPAIVDNGWITGASVRASIWSDAGDLSPYVAQSMYAGRTPTGRVAPVGSALLVGDTSLVPELTTGLQIGGDIALRRRMLSLGVTLYSERTSNVILPAAGTLGSVLARNAADVSNTGIEGRLGTRLGDGESGLGWDLSMSVTRNSNKVDKLYGTLASVPLGPTQWGVSVQARSGLPIGVLMGYRILRDPTGAMLLLNGLPLP
ncbi:MAG TPA: hypothetical protein VIP11_27455, partial [Gemmatimonadaceae bacterium]